jgi:hypothetical protein
MSLVLTFDKIFCFQILKLYTKDCFVDIEDMMVGSWQSSEMDKNLKFPCVMEHTGNSST